MTSETERPFGFWTATALVVGGMIGTGIFMLPANIAPFGWTGLIAWGVSIGGVLAIAYALGTLAMAMPEETGAVAITSRVLGTLPGVLNGWSYWVSCWAASAMLALGATSYLSVLVPAIATTPLAGALTAVALLWLITLLNLAGARIAGQFQMITTLLKLLPLLAVVVIVALLAMSGRSQLPPLPAPSTALSGIGAAITLTMFTLVGFEAAGVASERVRDPGRNVIRATMVGTAIAGLLYVVVSCGIVFSLPTAAVAASNAPVALFIETFWGHGPALLVAAFAVISAVGALNCWILIQSEVPLGMARAGLLPRWFGRVSAQDVPVRTLLLSTALASLLVLCNASKSLGGIFTFMALLTTSTALWFYLALCVAALVRRVAMPAAAIGLPFTLWAMWGAGIAVSALGLALTLTALPLYWLRPRGASGAGRADRRPPAPPPIAA
ncbi:APC family permease [Sphingomonas abietis]|uniref:Arginine/agmatine antiporter n=1 Tax=Sphingomonas abietis TaxID=3012344 RepID=A0ABY7NR88_9SPHN|nr:amino acid permease [Sphingomonas abietis]WBO23480.1 amino acid permease [Sphingomonas abietis]